MEKKNAIIFSGGSMKGAFQVGAFKAVIEAGMYPDFLYGVSVGALNSVYIATEAAKQLQPDGTVNWPQVADNLEQFWVKNITQPGSVARRRSKLELAFSALFSKFNGMLDMSPIYKLIDDSIDMNILYKSPVHVEVGTVNIFNGQITYATPLTPAFLEYVKGSSAIPIMMGGVNINESIYFDGGLRDVEPLSRAIDAHADEIVCILCQAKDLGTVGINPGNVVHLAERVMDIVVNEIVNNDIEHANEINKYTPLDGSAAIEGPYAGKRRINITTIRPESTLNIDIESFNSDDIKGLIKLGYETAKANIRNSSFAKFNKQALKNATELFQSQLSKPA